MSWIAMTDRNTPVFNIRGIGVPEDAPGARRPAGRDELLPIGTLMMELRHTADAGGARKLLAYRSERDWVREITIGFEASGHLVFELRQGNARSRAEIALPAPARDGRIRVSYSWHAPQRAARLTVELLDEGRLFQVHTPDPLPIPVRDVKGLMRKGEAKQIAPEVRVVAVSDAIEPVGFGSGIVTGTPVETMEGPVPVERLRLGDMVETAQSGPQPVRWIGKRTVPALGGFRPVRLRAPFFGLGADVNVSPDHRLRLDLAEADYMLGDDEVLIPAAHLVDGKHARREAPTRLVTYYQVLLDVHDCLLHDGLWSESLFVGTIRRRPDVVKSTVLAEMPVTAIPEHRAFARRKLSPFEARNLSATIGRRALP